VTDGGFSFLRAASGTEGETMNPLHHPAVTAPSLNPLRVGMLGIGVVGSGTCRVMERNRRLITARAGRNIELRALSTRTLARAHGLVGPEVALLADPLEVVRHPDIDVVIEVIGGSTVARSLVLEAIANGKHVVTANKALLALHGEEIFAAARRHGVSVAYEGAVAVSIPIVKALREGLAANRMEWLAGIVNGTSNFILSRMRDANLSFQDALAEAQRLGYAEADPTLDIGGFDAAHKLALLASLAFGMPLQFNGIAIEGIASVQPIDQHYAARLGYEIKQLAVARRQPAGVELRVHPALVSSSSLISRVDGAMNGILVNSDAAGLTMHYGAGAGSEQTASAVIADLIDIARLGPAMRDHAVPSLGFRHEALTSLPVVPIDDVVTRNYLRIPLADAAVAPRQALEVLARLGVAVSGNPISDSDKQQMALITSPIRDDRMNEALRQLQVQFGAREPAMRFRVEDFP